MNLLRGRFGPSYAVFCVHSSLFRHLSNNRKCLTTISVDNQESIGMHTRPLASVKYIMHGESKSQMKEDHNKWKKLFLL